MSSYLVQYETLANIAAAIREKTSISGDLYPSDMPEYIRSIEGSGPSDSGDVDTSKNGFYEEEGSYYYYVNGVRTYAGLLVIDGYYYYVSPEYKMVMDRTFWVSKPNGLLPEGAYTFDSQGRIILGESVLSPDVPNDIVAEAERVATSISGKIATNSITFIAMSDMHEMGDSDDSRTSIISQYRRANRNACQGAQLIADKISPDFFANLGDLAWGSSSTTTRDLAASIMQAQRYMDGIAEKTTCLMVPGNHDVDSVAGFVDPEMLRGLIGEYKYVDFTDKKIRVVCLNTADTTDGTNSTERISGEQLQWFAQALDLSGKNDAASWGILVLSHHPLDWDNIKPAANCLAAYLNGTTYSATHDGMTVSYDYSGKNAAVFIANFHGHVHCFKVGTISGTSAKRVAIPNACYARTNEYGERGNTEFGDETSYEKSDNGTGTNTSFCVISIDLDNQIIYADCFGAGIDRTIGYSGTDTVVYTVTSNLTNASSSETATVVAAGAGYSTTISANDGCEISTVTVTMGGEDITSSAYTSASGVVEIKSVTGNIVIKVVATSTVTYDVANLVLISEEQDSTEVYNNGLGYKNGVYASESGDGSYASCVATGWIPYTWSPSNVIYIRGASVTDSYYVRFYGWSSKTSVSNNGYANGEKLDQFFFVEELESGTYYKLTPINTVSDINYIRISLIGTGENLVITVNQEIVEGSLGGDESETPSSYTNLVGLSVDTDLTTVFNGTGYMNGAYASNAHYGSDESCVVTGFIRLPSNVKSIYVKGATWDTTNSHCRVHFFRTPGDTTTLNYKVHANEATDTLTIETLGDSYYKFTITKEEIQVAEVWYCMSLVGTGENLIITHDEPIE